MTDLENLINNYQTSAEARDVVREHPPVLIVGVSGAGKDYLISRLVATGAYHNMVTHTTRAPRQNDGVWEKDGEDYYFIDKAEALKMLEEGAYIEAKLVHDCIYGSSVAEYQKALDLGKRPIADVDVQGVVEYKKIAPGTRALFLLPPSYEVWMERLKSRFASEEDFLAVWPKRRDSSIRELEFALASHQFEWLINDDLERVVASAQELIAGSNDDFITAEQKEIAKDLLRKLKNEQN